MNKVKYIKTLVYKLFGKDIFKITENYEEVSGEKESDLPVFFILGVENNN